MGAILDGLRALRGSGKPKEVIDWIIQNYGITEDQAHDIFLKWVGIHSERRKSSEPSGVKEADAIDEIEVEENTSLNADYKQELLGILRKMTPLNFERFSLLLLRLNNFEDLRLTGGPKDEGIDGIGILRINPFVSFLVLFQCKRYGENNKIRRTQIADFRNSMLGRADKGIFITTTYFTRDAESEANRDGAPPVELVDADKLIDMIAKTGLVGLNPLITYEVDHVFFAQYTN